MLISWSNDMIKRGWTNANVLFLEEYFKIKVSGDMTMSGFIDLVFELDGETYLVDWKSNYKYLQKKKLIIQINYLCITLLLLIKILI